MSVISAIVPASRRPGRFDIMVDGEPLATLSLAAIERLRLAVGRSISGLEQVIADEATELKVHDRALNMLAFRARSAYELGRALGRKGEDRRMIERVIAALQERGLLDDAAFASAFARAKLVGARQSRRRVQQQLAAKGVPRDITDAVVAQVLDEEGVDPQELTLQVARKKLRTLTRLEPQLRARRLYAFLARRGHDADHIRIAMRLVDAHTTESEPD